MPRPGPRPYECVRRAWHSERHQPTRGLVIQQIFRLVHDNHSVVTKRNREWQEKLPIVVLKAEEIMYSKANSEAEYSDVQTLWDRVNDAVDTIIRKDESTEIGELLPPCVEAALNLGCVPIRASRSQRYNNPTTYLRPSYQECGDMPQRTPQKVVNETANRRESDLLIPLSTPNSSILKMPPNLDSARLVWEFNKRVTPNTNPHSIGMKNRIEVDYSTSLNRGSVYPLYHGTSFKSEASQLGLQETQTSAPVIVGVPIFSSAAAERAEVGCLKNLFPCGIDKNVGKEKCKVAPEDNKGKGPQTGFDLSLRLGLFSDSKPSREKGSGCGTDSFGHQNAQDGAKEFSFFPMYDRPWLHKSRLNWESEYQNVELVSKKRKLPSNANRENDHFFWSDESTSNNFPLLMRRRGS